MFFQAMIGILTLILAAWLFWKFVIKPILEAKGIEVDPEEEIKTSYTKKLDKLRTELAEKQVSNDAAEECVWLTEQIKELEAKIAEKEDKI